MRYRYKHPVKGDVWSRKSPTQWRKENGSGWRLVSKKTEAQFRKE